MRRFNSRRPIRRCGSGHDNSGGGLPRLDREIRAPENLIESCEVTFAPNISALVRSFVLGQRDLFCRMCGVIPGDIDDLTGQKVRFEVVNLENAGLNDEDGLANIEVLCSTCDQGTKEMKKERPSAIWLDA